MHVDQHPIAVFRRDFRGRDDEGAHAVDGGFFNRHLHALHQAWQGLQRTDGSRVGNLAPSLASGRQDIPARASWRIDQHLHLRADSAGREQLFGGYVQSLRTDCGTEQHAGSSKR